VREDAPVPEAPGGAGPFFHKSLEMGKQNLTAMVDEAWRTIGWTKPELQEYLTENISYSLGEAERESLALFYEKAVAHRFAFELKPLRFL
jgi:chorismate dehydratase